MSLKTGLRGLVKKASAAVVAVAAAASLMVAGTGTAAADNMNWLRPGCRWDSEFPGGVPDWVQRCDVYSEAMGKNIAVQIRPAERGGNAALYLLDGLRAQDTYNAWTRDSYAPAKFKGTNIALVMPIGGAASFYADWEGPAKFSSVEPVNYKWETFLTKELPGYLQQNFGVSPNNNSIAGLSMGGTAAMNLAAKHPEQFRQVLSYSGYLSTTMPGMQTLLGIALIDGGGFNINAMYGGLINPRRFENDPFLNMEGLRNTDVYVSAGNGVPRANEWGMEPRFMIPGSALEIFARYTTGLWTLKARAQGINFTEDFPPYGLHNWTQFDDQLNWTRDRILRVMNAY
ncbi:esterase family protein [Corynebacterium uropygiale]|uniref:Esterase family protein n=1 Tax=Corynebacterium uropygiale TaxID=1775911 RepID=A0A9X1QUP5_9CORY|nr:alpha/beta hydrolase family protein [Corynebacterium uropygiale]MCF4007335.1 esterase family protein [Corynebacterium uropygiale]